MNGLIIQVNRWAKERGLDKADSTKQIIKLMEEVGELAEGHIKKNKAQVMDSIGDVLVVLDIYCLQEGISMIECLELAYNEIKDRKGKMIDSVFVKESDLTQ